MSRHLRTNLYMYVDKWRSAEIKEQRTHKVFKYTTRGAHTHSKMYAAGRPARLRGLRVLDARTDKQTVRLISIIDPWPIEGPSQPLAFLSKLIQLQHLQTESVSVSDGSLRKLLVNITWYFDYIYCQTKKNRWMLVLSNDLNALIIKMRCGSGMIHT